MPLISAVIPVYNGEQTIEETIASVLTQTVIDLEIIVVNDGSTDGTLEVISSIADDFPAGTLRERLHIFSYPNAGLATSRNRGIEKATGEYIAFLDADDLWRQDKLELQLRSLQENPQAAVAYSWTDFIDEESHFLRPGSHISASGNVWKKLLQVNFIENGSNVLIRKTVFDRIGTFDPNLSTAADWEMWLRIARHFEFVTVEKVQVLYRFSPSSMSAKIRHQETECLQVLNRNFAAFSPDDLQLQRDCLANLYRYLIFRCFECDRYRQFGFAAIDFLLKVLYYDPKILYHKKLVLSVLLRSTALILLPSAMARSLQQRLDRLCSLYDLFIYTKLS